MNNTEEVIRQYLEMHTSYAILINGERGIGKTYFIKNNFPQIIKGIPVHHNHKKVYKPLYISLYGVSTMEDVYSMMLMEIAPLLKNKKVQLSFSLGKLVARGFLQFKNLEGFSDILDQSNNVLKATLDTKEFVFIIDDLDRRSETLHINSVIGFVNSLVEHENNKIIIIADNKHIDDEEYHAVKEKTIGVTIDYIMSIDEMFDSMTMSYTTQGFSPFTSFLNDHKSIILKCFQISETNNLRILKYLFDHLLTIYGSIHDSLGLHKTGAKDDLTSKKLENIVKFCTAITLEFRKGKISSQNRKSLDNRPELEKVINSASMRILFDSTDYGPREQSEPNELEVFLTNFYPEHDYNFYPSLYQFITGGDGFKKDELISELIEAFDKHSRIVEAHDQLYDELSYHLAIDLSNKDLKLKTKMLLAYAFECKFDLSKYLGIFYYVYRFNTIFKWNLIFIAKKLSSSLERNKNKFKYTYGVGHHFSPDDYHENKSEFAKIYKKTVEVNDFAKNKEVLLANKVLFETFLSDPNVFYSMYYQDNIKTGALSVWNTNKTISKLKAMTPSQIEEFANFIQRVTTAFDKSDRDCIRQLLKEVEKVKQRNNTKTFAWTKLKKTFLLITSS